MHPLNRVFHPSIKAGGLSGRVIHWIFPSLLKECTKTRIKPEFGPDRTDNLCPVPEQCKIIFGVFDQTYLFWVLGQCKIYVRIGLKFIVSLLKHAFYDLFIFSIPNFK